MRPNPDAVLFASLARLRQNMIDLTLAIEESPWDTDADLAQLAELYRLLAATRAALDRLELHPTTPETCG